MTQRKLDRPTRIRPGVNLVGPADLEVPERRTSPPYPVAPLMLPSITIDSPEFDQHTVDQLVEIAEELRRAVPHEWAEIRYSFSEVGNSACRRFEWISEDGKVTEYEPNKSLFGFATPEEGRSAIAAKKCPPRPLTNWCEPEIFSKFSSLRASMLVPKHGTWFTTVYTIDNAGHANLNFDYDSEPRFFPLLVNGIYRLDQQRYPRDMAHTPHWLQHKLELAQSNPLGFS